MNIPTMTDPIGRYWSQPSVETIAVDEKYAIMDRTSFDMLLDYSCSQPTAVYVGKMWKRREPYLDAAPKHAWYLCWYDVSEKGPNWCSTKMRGILLV